MSRHCISWVVLVMVANCLSSTPTRAAAPPKPPLRLPATQPSTRPVAVPSAVEFARANRVVQEVFARELAGQSRQERQTAAKVLLQQVGNNAHDPAGRYVLLKLAGELSATSGDALLATAAIGQLCQLYTGLDRQALTLAAMSSAIAAADSPQAYGQIGRICLEQIDDAIVKDDYAVAAKLSALASQAAEKSDSGWLRSSAREQAGQLQTLFLRYKAVEKAQQKLADNGQDAIASATVGQFYCLIKGDWPAGLPLLARGDDAFLRRLAEMELASSPTTAQRFELAGHWWDQSLNSNGLTRRNLASRAAYWYARELPRLTGLNRGLAEQRLLDYQQQAAADQGLEAGVLARLYKGNDHLKLAATRIDQQIDFDWGLDAPDGSLPKDSFSIRWLGRLRPMVGGDYELTVQAKQGVRIWLDDQLVIDQPLLSRQRNGVSIVIGLAAKDYRLRIDYWDSSGAARVRLAWKPPFSTKASAIPSWALWHDPLLDAVE